MNGPLPGRYRAELLDAKTDFADIEASWRRLADEAEDANCFALPGYYRAWQSTLADDVDTRVVAVREGDRLLGIMPIMRALVWRGPSCVPRHDYAPADRALLLGRRPRPFPLRQISSVVSMPAAMTGPAPLCYPGTEADVTLAMARALVQLPRWDVIVLPCFEGTEQENWLSAFRALGLQPWVHQLGRTIQCLRRVRPFDVIVAGQNRNFRRNVRRAQEAAGKLEIAFAAHEGCEAVAQAFATIERVAKASWKHAGKAETGLRISYAGRQQTFFERLLTDPGIDVSPILWTAAIGDRPIGVCLALRSASTVTGLLIFRDEDYPEASPGLLLVGRLIDWCAQRGIKYFDLNTTHEWARHLADDVRSMNNVVVFAPTLAGRMFSLVSKAARWRR